jgi:hypothetical protein
VYASALVVKQSVAIGKAHAWSNTDMHAMCHKMVHEQLSHPPVFGCRSRRLQGPA